MATRAKTTGNSKETRRSSQGKAADDEMLTEVKKEKDEISEEEDDKKDFALDEDKITREEFERAMSSQEYPCDVTKTKGADKATKMGEDDDPKDQDDLTRGDADDAELDDEKIQLDAKDYAEFLNWKAGEKRLRDEERKMRFRALLKEKERTDTKYKLF